ncbi:MAG: hypothetical protein GX321_02575 [Clostridiales bacterium]|nr:hypothetical protein [Clostridiales bacterium]
MSKLIIIERNENVASKDELITNVADVIADTVMDDVVTDEVVAEDSVAEDIVTDEADMNIEELGSEEDISGEGLDGDAGYSEDVISEEGFVDEFMDYSGEDMIMDPGFDDGMYMDPGYDEGMYMDPGMEMGMGEVKDPLLSSWPFVIGISSAVLVVSIVVGALLAKLRIKKGIDLYED